METKCKHVKEEKILSAGGESAEENEDAVIKKGISCHALYGLLVEMHVECLKLCSGNIDKMEGILETEPKIEDNQVLSSATKSELDTFMVEYCLTLKRLKKAMQEPQLESMAFINRMHCQLQELLETTTSFG